MLKNMRHFLRLPVNIERWNMARTSESKAVAMLIFHIFISIIILYPRLSLAKVKSLEAKCGDASFRIEEKIHEHPLTTEYRLFGKSANSSYVEKLLYSSDEGDWFYANCLISKNGIKFLVFQSSCGGSVCVEDKYGIVNTKTLRVILRPNRKNIGNKSKASEILEIPVPHFPRNKENLCCK